MRTKLCSSKLLVLRTQILPRLADDEEISLADLAVEGEEEAEVAASAEDDTLSLSDIAEEEASLEDDAETE